jgi:hypothetical protein
MVLLALLEPMPTNDGQVAGVPSTRFLLADFLSSGGYDSHLRRIRRTFAGNIDQMARAIERDPAVPPNTRSEKGLGFRMAWGGAAKLITESCGRMREFRS